MGRRHRRRRKPARPVPVAGTSRRLRHPARHTRLGHLVHHRPSPPAGAVLIPPNQRKRRPRRMHFRKSGQMSLMSISVTCEVWISTYGEFTMTTLASALPLLRGPAGRRSLREGEPVEPDFLRHGWAARQPVAGRQALYEDQAALQGQRPSWKCARWGVEGIPEGPPRPGRGRHRRFRLRPPRRPGALAKPGQAARIGGRGGGGGLDLDQLPAGCLDQQVHFSAPLLFAQVVQARVVAACGEFRAQLRTYRSLTYPGVPVSRIRGYLFAT